MPCISRNLAGNYATSVASNNVVVEFGIIVITGTCFLGGSFLVLFPENVNLLAVKLKDFFS